MRSDEDLSSFVSAIKEDVFILWDECSSNGSFIGFETNLVGTNGPDEDIEEILRIFSISNDEVLDTCKEKVLDIGFEGGDIGDPVDVSLSNILLLKLAEIGFSINLRVYPSPD